MTNQERVTHSLAHQQPDRIPYHIDFTIKAHEKMAEYLGDPHFREKIDNCLQYLSLGRPGFPIEIQPGIFEDEYGAQWNRTVDKDIGVVQNCRIIPANLDEYHFPNPDAPERYVSFENLKNQTTGKFRVANIGFSLFERAWTLAGMENILMGMVQAPEFVHGLLDKILAYNLGLIENACRYPIDAMMFGDDWGQQSGLIMGPKLWREFILPRITAMYQTVRRHGKFVFIHSCGKVDEIFPDLIQAGIHVFNPFQPEVIDVFEIKRNFGDRLSFFGGISTQRTLPFASAPQVRDQVKRLLAEVGKNGGYIAAPAHSIPGDAKPENILAMLEVLENQ